MTIQPSSLNVHSFFIPLFPDLFPDLYPAYLLHRQQFAMLSSINIVICSCLICPISCGSGLYHTTIILNCSTLMLLIVLLGIVCIRLVCFCVVRGFRLIFSLFSLLMCPSLLSMTLYPK